jgi:hypothetical protein
MNGNYVQKFIKSLNLSFIKEIPNSLTKFIEVLQISENWDNEFSKSSHLNPDLNSNLANLSMFSIQTIIDLGNAEETSIRNKNSQLLFILSNKSEKNPIQIKAFEHERLHQIREEICFDDLINKIVFLSGRTEILNNVLLLNDRNIQFFEIANEEQEEIYRKKIESTSVLKEDEFFDFMFNREEFKSLRINEQRQETEDSDEEINDMIFKHIKG